MASSRAETASFASLVVKTIAAVLSLTVLVAGVVLAATPASASPYIYDPDRGSDWLSTSGALRGRPEQRIPGSAGFAAQATRGYDDTTNLECTSARLGFYRSAPNTSPKVTEPLIRQAMADAPLQSQQGAVSLPKVQSYVDKLASGSPAPPIKVDGSIIVDGNHRYIAGRIMGQEPAIQPWPGGSAARVVPWWKQVVDPSEWLG